MRAALLLLLLILAATTQSKEKIEKEKMLYVCSGLPRTNSTMLFNIVRLLVAEADPNVISGYDVDNTTIAAALDGNVSVVVKTHLHTSAYDDHFLTDRGGVFLLSHTLPSLQLCSLALMRMGPAAARARRGGDGAGGGDPPPLSQDVEEWRAACQTAMRWQHDVYATWGQRVVLDEDLSRLEPGQAVRRVAAALRLHVPQTRMDVIARTQEQLRGIDPGTFPHHHPVNLYHASHRHSADDHASCTGMLASVFDADAVCSAWQAGGGAYQPGLVSGGGEEL